MLFGGQTGLSAATNATSVATAHLTNVWLGHVAVTAAISLVPVTAALTAREVIRDRGVVASVAGPTIHVPRRYIVRAGRHTMTPDHHDRRSGRRTARYLRIRVGPRPSQGDIAADHGVVTGVARELDCCGVDMAISRPCSLLTPMVAIAIDPSCDVCHSHLSTSTSGT